MKKTRSLIVCGFPGTGKSTFANNKTDMVDLKSSIFSWIFDPEFKGHTQRNTLFPKNYADEIERRAMDNEHYLRYLFISSHKEVRDELKERAIPYIIVAPLPELKDEYIARYARRGSDIALIDLIYSKWDEMLKQLDEDGMPVIHLKSGQYIEDVLK